MPVALSKPWISDEEKAAVLEVLESGHLVQGARVAQLEDAFRHLTGAEHAVATSSGSTGLMLALLAHGIGPGDEVVTTPFTFIASVNCVLQVGATPVLADIEADTFNLDPAAVRRAITPRTRSIIPVHLYGHPCEMDELAAIAAEHGIALIEDAAQAVGASYKDRPVGGSGTAVFSLYATKNVMSAEGGIVTTIDERVAEGVRLLRNHGQSQRYHHEILGYNFRMTDLHAALGLAQLSRLDEIQRRRAANAAYLNAHLTRLAPPVVRAECRHSWHQYTVRTPAGLDRDECVSRLKDAGIDTGVFYPVPAHMQPYIRERCVGASLPVAEQAAREVFSLPVHPLLERADLEYIVAEVNRL